MTPSTKPVTRESSAYVRDRGLRPIIATITGSVVELRAKGLRSREYIDLAWAYQFAVKARVQQERLAKRRGARK